MLELCDQEEVDRLVAGHKMALDDYHLRYQSHLSATVEKDIFNSTIVLNFFLNDEFYMFVNFSTLC